MLGHGRVRCGRTVAMREISAEKLSYVIAKAREMASEVEGRGADGSKRTPRRDATAAPRRGPNSPGSSKRWTKASSAS